VSVDNEIYDRFAATWWAEDGMLHFLKTALEPVRFGYFQRILTEGLRLDPAQTRVVDVGCGGGILAEDFARLGCRATGIDPSEPSLTAARSHAAREGLDIRYAQAGGERLPFADASFGVACCCDVLEHVGDVDAVIAEIARVLKPGGVFFYDTVNRTLRSWLAAIKVMQEWAWSSFAPPGLHDWKMFIKPVDLAANLRRHGLEPHPVVGMAPALSHPLALVKALRERKKGRITYAELGRRLRFKESRDTSVSYLGYALKGAGGLRRCEDDRSSSGEDRRSDPEGGSQRTNTPWVQVGSESFVAWARSNQRSHARSSSSGVMSLRLRSSSLSSSIAGISFREGFLRKPAFGETDHALVRLGKVELADLGGLKLPEKRCRGYAIFFEPFSVGLLLTVHFARQRDDHILPGMSREGGGDRRAT
jgi:2-polyprenyl-6-hydroxyphenyl methylase / 3-demethylubiquinone-9 3-methyltransferase